MSTRAIAAKTALLDTIKALPALSGYRVTWGYPARTPERRWVFVGEISWPDAEWSTNRSRTEVFDIALVLNCQISAASSEDVERELEAVAAGIEDALKANPTLGVAGVLTSDFIPRKLSSYPSDQVYEGQYEIDVRFKARP